MAGRKADMSVEAQQVFAELQASGITLPTAQNCVQYRKDLRDASQTHIESILDQYDVETTQVEVAGVPCRQQTPASWSSQDGICIVYAYGGGYVSGGTYEDQVITIAMASLANARVISVEYRLSPEHPYPAAQQDMSAVYQSLLELYGSTRLVISGESAGGNLALSLLQRVRDQGVALPRCAVLFSPWVDLSNQGDSHIFNDKRDPTLNNAWVDSAADLHADGHALDDAGISPIHGEMQGLPPCIITTGSCDLLLSQCLRLANRLRAVDVDCDLRVWEGLWHVFEYYPIPEARQSIVEVSCFIEAHCQPQFPDLPGNSRTPCI